MKSIQYLSLLLPLLSIVKALPASPAPQILETVGNVAPLDHTVELNVKRQISDHEATVDKVTEGLIPSKKTGRRSILDITESTVASTKDTASGFVNLPATSKRDGSVEGVGELVGSLSDALNYPHIPLEERDILNTVTVIAGPIDDTTINLAENVVPLDGPVKKRVLDTVTEIAGDSVDLNKPFRLDAPKKKTTKKDSTGDSPNLGGHSLPIEALESLAEKVRSIFESSGTVAGKEKRTTFNADTQRIDVTGAHTFVPPNFENGDTRGPCPGLNALANHGFINHNGVATMLESIVATNQVFGMGIDISTILGVYGSIVAGDVVSLSPSFSIGRELDEDQKLLGNLLGLLGTPRGLNGTHNAFEEDASGTRGDLYDGGNDNSGLNMTYFMELYNLQIDTEEPNYSMEVIGEHNIARYKQTGLVVRNAAYAFTGRLYVNTSQEYPDGRINKETLKSFFGVTGEEGNLVGNVVWERIPDIWYRRSGDYGLLSYAADLVQWCIKYPQLLNIGGNTNGVNTFTGLDFGNITGGLINVEGLLEGNNILCFTFEFVKEFGPSLRSASLFSSITASLQSVLDVLDGTLLSLNCPAYNDLGVGGTDFLEQLKSTYPGVAKSGVAL